MDQPEIEITIANVTPAEAGTRIGELQSWLEQKTQNLELQRIAPDKTTQDLGLILLVLAPFAAEAAGAFLYEAAKDGAKQIAAWMRKHRQSINVSAKGEPQATALDPDAAERIVYEYLKRKYEALEAAAQKQNNGATDATPPQNE